MCSRLVPRLIGVLLLCSSFTPLAPAQFFAPATIAISADETGWTVDGARVGGPYALCATVWLTADAPWPVGAVVLQETAEIQLPLGSALFDSVPFSASGAWSEELAPGNYFATVLALQFLGTACDGSGILVTQLIDESELFVVDPPPPPQTDPRCPRFWRKNPEAWPVSQLELGGVIHDQDELLDILSTRRRRDATVPLARQLIAAKLNLAAGALTVEEAQPVIDDADSFLMDHPLGSRPRGCARRQARVLRKALRILNCGEPRARRRCPRARRR